MAAILAPVAVPAAAAVDSTAAAAAEAEGPAGVEGAADVEGGCSGRKNEVIGHACQHSSGLISFRRSRHAGGGILFSLHVNVVGGLHAGCFPAQRGVCCV